MRAMISVQISAPFPLTEIVSPRSGERTTSVICDVTCAIAFRISLRLYTASRAFPLYLESTDIVGKNPTRRFPDNFCLENYR
jgi:hypothetical protein